MMRYHLPSLFSIRTAGVPIDELDKLATPASSALVREILAVERSLESAVSRALIAIEPAAATREEKTRRERDDQRDFQATGDAPELAVGVLEAPASSIQVLKRNRDDQREGGEPDDTRLGCQLQEEIVATPLSLPAGVRSPRSGTTTWLGSGCTTATRCCRR